MKLLTPLIQIDVMQFIIAEMSRIVLKIAFYVSGAARRLMKLFDKDSKILESTHLIVFDNPPFMELKNYAKKRNIEFLEIDYKALGLLKKQRNKYLSNLLLNAFKRLQITHCFCFGRLLLEGRLLSVYKNKIINFHPSILPLFAGNRAIDKALESKAFLLGNTAHFIDEGMDSGPIIMQSILKASDFRDYESVLSLQIPMIEEIYSYLQNDLIINDTITLKSHQNPAFFPNIKEIKPMKVLFIGNRLRVLDEILKSHLHIVKILIAKDSYAHKHTRLTNIIVFENKEQVLDEIKNCDFDLLVSNGCPYILPVSRLKKPHQKFINIHPSLLPRLRGKHPINGAILFHKKAGVSVHTMSDEVDKGEILSQIEIPLKNLSLALLYKLCFRAEAMAFTQALKNGFQPIQIKPYKESYYSRNKDISIPLNSTNKVLLRTINAFGMEHIATKLITKLGEFRVLEIKKIKNEFLYSLKYKDNNLQNYEILESYEDRILLYKDNEFLEMRFVASENLEALQSKFILWDSHTTMDNTMGGGSPNEIFVYSIVELLQGFLANTITSLQRYLQNSLPKALQGGSYALS